MNETYHILIVEDDQDINRLLCKIMTDAGYNCRPAFSGSEAEMLAERYDYDLILLDLMLPGLTGEEFITRIRKRKSMPILGLSAKTSMEDKVSVLHLGADDYIPKPFNNAEVLARVEAQLRRFREFSSPLEKKNILLWGDLCLDREGMSVTAAGQIVALTVREFEILALLMSSPQKVFTRAQLYEEVWGEEFYGDDNTVNVHVSNLRSKLNKACGTEYIKTVWGIGFKMNDL